MDVNLIARELEERKKRKAEAESKVVKELEEKIQKTESTLAATTAKLKEKETEEELVKNIRSYNPANVTTNLLLDDWQMVSSWYTTMNNGGAVKHSREDIINASKLIYEELSSRGIAFSPSTMKKDTKRLFDIVSNKVAPQSLERQKEIKEFDTLPLAKGCVSLVGTYVNSRFSNTSQIDLLIDLDEPEDASIRTTLESSITKMLPQETAEKVKFLWGDQKRSFDECIPLYDLVLVRNRPEIKELYTVTELKLMEPALPLQENAHSFFNSSSAATYVFADRKWNKAVLEKKFDGFRLMVHKKGPEVKIFSETGQDVTHAFPMHVAHTFNLSDKDFILDCSAVPYGTGNRPLGRATMSRFIESVKDEKKIDDSAVIFHAFDVLYLGEDISSKPWHERKRALNSLKFTNTIQEVSSVIVENEKKLESTAKMLGDLPGSQGAVIKNYDSIYTLSSKTSDWISYKTEQTAKVRVLSADKTENENLYNYKVGIDVTSSQSERLAKGYMLANEDVKVLLLGGILNVKEKADVGEVIEISLEEVWRHKIPSGIHYSLHKPHVLSVQALTATTSLDELDALVSSRGAEIIHQG